MHSCASRLQLQGRWPHLPVGDAASGGMVAEWEGRAGPALWTRAWIWGSILGLRLG